MKIRTLITIIVGLLMAHLSFGQDQEKYLENVMEAWGLYESKDYKHSAEKY